MDISPTQPTDDAASHLRQDFETWQALLEAQPAMVQRFLERQAQQLAEALTRREPPSQITFTLPDQVVLQAGERPAPLPPVTREQMAGGLVEQLTRTNAATALHRRLAELDQSPHREVAVAAGLLRHAVVVHMVRELLPSGRNVTYRALEGEEIPSLPAEDALEPGSAITAATDAIAEEAQDENGRGALLVPFVPAARRFYLPQWVAFDDQGKLLAKSVSEAEGHVASMQRFLAVLHTAVALAPYVVADDVYQQKRYGMLGQLVNQGRALARYQTDEIIQTIKRRAAAQDLNRGLSLSLPYFDDQDLRLKTHKFEVIPAGRIMFVPALVVRAMHAEQAKVAQDTRLDPSTRRHLLSELKAIETAFASASDS